MPRRLIMRGVSTGLRLGRGTAERVVTVAGPTLGRLTGLAAGRLRRPTPASTTTFTPSKRPVERADELADELTEAAPEQDRAASEPGPGAQARRPSPAVVARNIAPRRPAARPARPAKPASVPGAKLPPPRPSTS